jgi:hypothetical protein
MKKKILFFEVKLLSQNIVRLNLKEENIHKGHCRRRKVRFFEKSWCNWDQREKGVKFCEPTER